MAIKWPIKWPIKCSKKCSPNQFPNILPEAQVCNVWLVRQLQSPLIGFSDEDTWEVLHEHPGGNQGPKNM